MLGPSRIPPARRWIPRSPVLCSFPLTDRRYPWHVTTEHLNRWRAQWPGLAALDLHAVCAALHDRYVLHPADWKSFAGIQLWLLNALHAAARQQQETTDVLQATARRRAGIAVPFDSSLDFFMRAVSGNRYQMSYAFHGVHVDESAARIVVHFPDQETYEQTQRYHPSLFAYAAKNAAKLVFTTKD